MGDNELSLKIDQLMHLVFADFTQPLALALYHECKPHGTITSFTVNNVECFYRNDGDKTPIMIHSTNRNAPDWVRLLYVDSTGALQFTGELSHDEYVDFIKEYDALAIEGKNETP